MLGAETVVLHLALVPRHPVLAWILTAGSLGTMAWLVADYQAMGRGVVRLDSQRLELSIGRRANVTIPLTAVADVRRPTWRDLPETGTPAAADYLNLVKPAEPNVLLGLHAPVRVRIVGGITRSARQIGLCLDAPDAFVTAVHAMLGREHPVAH